MLTYSRTFYFSYIGAKLFSLLYSCIKEFSHNASIVHKIYFHAVQFPINWLWLIYLFLFIVEKSWRIDRYKIEVIYTGNVCVRFSPCLWQGNGRIGIDRWRLFCHAQLMSIKMLTWISRLHMNNNLLKMYIWSLIFSE